MRVGILHPAGCGGPRHFWSCGCSDLHALLTVAAVGLVFGRGNQMRRLGCSGSTALGRATSVLSVEGSAIRRPGAARCCRHRLEIDRRRAGYRSARARTKAFLRAWAMTILNWAVKVVVLAWVLAIMGVAPLAACFGGALGGELSSVLADARAGGRRHLCRSDRRRRRFLRSSRADRAALEQSSAGAGVNAHLHDHRVRCRRARCCRCVLQQKAVGAVTVTGTTSRRSF